MPRMISIEDLGQYPTDGDESGGWRDDAYMKGIHGPTATKRSRVRPEDLEEEAPEDFDGE